MLSPSPCNTIMRQREFFSCAGAKSISSMDVLERKKGKVGSPSILIVTHRFISGVAPSGSLAGRPDGQFDRRIFGPGLSFAFRCFPAQLIDVPGQLDKIDLAAAQRRAGCHGRPMIGAVRMEQPGLEAVGQWEFKQVAYHPP